MVLYRAHEPAQTHSDLFLDVVTEHAPSYPLIIPRSAHPISRANISPSALKVLYRLKDGGFDAYLVGGGVRDLLIGRTPKDFDIATNARPEQVKDLFRNCRLIGRRFRLAHVRFGREVIEVATFRAGHPQAEEAGHVTDAGRILRDNVYGSMEEDAYRRDFSINGLYYNIRDFSVVDYMGAMQDLEAGVVRIIGDPAARFREDPVRVLRAIRFAAKLDFALHPDTAAAMEEFALLLESIPPARLFDEVLKLLLSGAATKTYALLREFGVVSYLFPQTAKYAKEQGGYALLDHALENTDLRLAEEKPVTPGFLFAALLWGPMQGLCARYKAQGASEYDALETAGVDVLTVQSGRIALPRRFSFVAREIWRLQPRFEKRRGRRPLGLMAHPRFRAAYDFLLLRAQAGEDVGELATWWTEYQQSDEAGRRMAEAAPDSPTRRRRGRRPKRARH